MDWKSALWFVGMWFVGSFVCGTFGMQIRIINNCTRKIIEQIKNDRDFWNPDDCEKYLKTTIWMNLAIILVATFLIVLFAPLSALIGYAVGYVLCHLRTGAACGLISQNIDESFRIILRFAKPEKYEEMAEALTGLKFFLTLDHHFKR